MEIKNIFSDYYLHENPPLRPLAQDPLVYAATLWGHPASLKVLPDVQSPVAVVIYTDTHTYKQKVLLYSKFMFNSKATANGNRYVREHH